MKRGFCNRYGRSPIKAILLSMLIIFICASAFCGCVSAEDVSDWNSLKDALTSSDATTDIKLTKDITATEGVTVAGIKTLDLNGKGIETTQVININNDAKLTVINGTITNTQTDGSTGKVFTVDNGSLIIGDKCTIKMKDTTGFCTINVYGTDSEGITDYSSLIVENGAKIEGESGIIVRGNKTTDPTKAYGVNVNVNGNVTSTNTAITINGVVSKTEGNVPEIIVGPKAVLDGPVYAAGYGKWTFQDGCSVTGNDALMIKSGEFTINGGTFIGNGEYKEPEPYGNGMYSSGAAIQVTSHDSYAGDVVLNINGGRFTSENNSALLY
ncbi:MAG TPA: hypothetical protein O0W90_00905, partial [Methanocorpusculum sp.]|nr:hypothetical protein [Methanocorpusculum sp.]